MFSHPRPGRPGLDLVEKWDNPSESRRETQAGPQSPTFETQGDDDFSQAHPIRSDSPAATNDSEAGHRGSRSQFPLRGARG